MVNLLQPISLENVLAPQPQQQILNPTKTRLAQALIAQGTSTEPIATPLGGLARALTGVVGGFVEKRERERAQTEEQQRADALAKAIRGATGPIQENPQIIDAADAGGILTSPQPTDRRTQLVNALLASGDPRLIKQAAGFAIEGIGRQEGLTATLAAEKRAEAAGVRATELQAKVATTASERDFQESLRLQAAKPATLTSAVKNALSLGLKQGTPEFNQFVTNASAKGTTVNVTTGLSDKATEKFDEITGKAVAERDQAREQLAIDAGENNFTLRQLGTSIADGSINTGSFAPTVLMLKKLGEPLGIDVDAFLPEGVALGDTVTAETFNEFNAKLTLKAIKPLGRNPTDKDLEFTQKTVASLSKTPDANLVNMAKGITTNNQAVAFRDFKDQLRQNAIDSGSPLNELAVVRRAEKEFQFDIGADFNKELFDMSGKTVDQALGKFPVPQNAAREALLSDPSKAAIYDEKFGVGAAALLLGGQ